MPLREAAYADAAFDVLLTGARQGDQEAWRALAHRLKNVAWAVINNWGLRGADAQDAFQFAFERLAKSLGSIREPAKLPGWMATTTRNECRRIGRERMRVEPRDELPEPGDSGPGRPEEQVLELELTGDVRAAFLDLPERCQHLLRLVFAVPPMSYDEISELLGGLPRGSIGPTRGRCLDELRKLLVVRGHAEAAR
jgi:RNA polymerase sigma factor (sigma-70 family)